MTDYTHSSGNSSTMMIRDTGTIVEYWLNSNNSTTWSDHLPWGWNINGSSGSSTYNYQPGAGWKKLGSWNVTTSQNVTFSLGATGTSGFGGPTTFTQFINRATVPPAPSIVTLSSITSTSMNTVFTGNGDGGSAITAWQLGYGVNTSTPDTIVDSSGTLLISGLTPGTTYYFWARGVNGVGAGPWGPRSQATTLRIPDATTTPVLSNIGPQSVTVAWSPNGDGGTPITGYQIGYATTNTTPTTTVAATSPATITGLNPGTTYYFWTRAQNSVGWGPWSASASAMTIAGVRINVSGVWKLALPYVKDGGVWKLARPYVRVAGVWKETV